MKLRAAPTEEPLASYFTRAQRDLIAEALIKYIKTLKEDLS